MRGTLSLLAVAAALTGCGGGEERSRPPASPTATAVASSEHPGLEVWRAQGCGSCHRFRAAGSNGELGPDLDASEHVGDRGYVTASIVDPSAEDRSGFGTGMMPEDYAGKIGENDLEALVELITTRAGTSR